MLKLRRLLSPLSVPVSLSLSTLLVFTLALVLAAQPPAFAAGKKEKKDKKAKAEQGEEKEEEKWDVSNPPLPTSEVEIDLTEGTWMSVDVSPEGDEIVFDLLGDLFLLPIEGGEAKALTQGMAWDMQPRFSPDGKSVAFTSDRGGGDNVWVMGRDGSEPKAVSEESFRLLNNPAWSPDGDFIAARKHFTSTRSLGSGEIWLYHKSGGGGLQMNEKPNDQKDLGEPAFSPDGRWVYFSQDATPGGTFQYNKDSNTEIYVIQRLDRETGEIEPFVTGPGGAVRPTPSPDGNLLAFVRRVRFESCLFLKDLGSGREWKLTGGLDRDMQETWAVHGVYPGMAWTPDSGSIVYWAGGRIRRVDVATAAVSEIPFHVKAKHRIVDALRRPVEVAPETTRVKMLRWVRVSPAGDRAVFQALGYLWVRELPDGEPRRLTSQEEHSEVYPAFSRDGRRVVYTTWSDAEKGSVRIVSADGGEGRAVTSEPGHYVEPALSPDGEWVVYRKDQGGYLRTPEWSLEPGIYRVPAAGGEAERITEDGFEPHFGAASDRVFLLRASAPDERSLVSIGLGAFDGRQERTHLESKYMGEARVSPDGRWVAFIERFHAYVAPFTAAARPIAAGPDMKSVPVKRVTKNAGESLGWSGDSQTLHWSLGPELFSRDLKDAFAFLEGAPEELPDPAEHGLDLGFEVPSDVPSGSLALVGGRLITVRADAPEEVIEDGAVVVEGNRITAVGPRAEIEVPAGATVVDVAGKTLMPGIVDVHWHGAQGTSEIIPEQNWSNYASLAFGVTTLHDPSNDTSEIFAAAELARTGKVLAPRIFSTGTILYGATTAFTAEIDSLEDARTHLKRMKAAGAFSVKSYNQPRRDQRQQVIKAALEEGMMVMPEGGSLLQHNLTMIVDGHTGIEHSIPAAKVYEDVLALWAASRTWYTPTLGVGYGGIWGENYWYRHTDVWANERLLSFVPRRFVDPVARRPMHAPEEEYNHVSNAEIAKQLFDRGVRVMVGAHGQREGLAAHWEMWMFEQGGMTPLEAIRSATLSGAEYLGMDADIGSLEAGKLADLVVLPENPLENLRSSEHVELVMLNGRLFDAATLHEIGNHPREREPFFFEGEGAVTGCSTGACDGPAYGRCAH